MSYNTAYFPFLLLRSGLSGLFLFRFLFYVPILKQIDILIPWYMRWLVQAIFLPFLLTANTLPSFLLHLSLLNILILLTMLYIIIYFYGTILSTLHFWSCFRSRKFYIRRNNNKVDSIEIGRIVIANLPPWSDSEKYIYTTFF